MLIDSLQRQLLWQHFSPWQISLSGQWSRIVLFFIDRVHQMQTVCQYWYYITAAHPSLQTLGGGLGSAVHYFTNFPRFCRYNAHELKSLSSSVSGWTPGEPELCCMSFLRSLSSVYLLCYINKGKVSHIKTVWMLLMSDLYLLLLHQGYYRQLKLN